MLNATQGTYHDGIVELDEKPDNIISGRVVVTFLENNATKQANFSTNAEQQIANLREWLATLPDVAHVPLEALDREQLYR